MYYRICLKKLKVKPIPFTRIMIYSLYTCEDGSLKPCIFSINFPTVTNDPFLTSVLGEAVSDPFFLNLERVINKSQ